MGPVERERAKMIDIFFDDAYGKSETLDLTIPRSNYAWSLCVSISRTCSSPVD